ncbi:MAG: tetratricopeptide repeat protein, partial [Deltaproteobacteria bacterium]|nr:tetratricopeptide repeat protein [Deltaproteobacteria bacterium]
EMLMAYDNLGKSYLQIGHFDKALRTFDILADLRPDLEGGLIGKGLVYHTMGKYGKAIAAFKEALGIRSESASAYYNLACAFARGGFLEKARAALAKAVELNPGYEKKAERDSDLEIVR